MGLHRCWKWVLCQCVSVCVSMCQYVLFSLCCWLRQCWRQCVGCCVVVTVRKKKKTKSVIPKKYPLQIFINSKNKICTTHFCNYLRGDGMSKSTTPTTRRRSEFHQITPIISGGNTAKLCLLEHADDWSASTMRLQ